MSKIRLNMIIWSHGFFVAPILLALINGLFWHPFIATMATIVSVLHHLSPKSAWRIIDKTFVHILISSNLVLCYLSGFALPYFAIALVFVAVAFYFYFKGSKGNYERNHSLWHIASAVITFACVAGYVAG